jgi:hypothetical protein
MNPVAQLTTKPTLCILFLLCSNNRGSSRRRLDEGKELLLRLDDTGELHLRRQRQERLVEEQLELLFCTAGVRCRLD